MEKYLILYTKSSGRFYAVRKNEDNTIVISNTTSGESIANAGLLICNMGGIDAVLSKCEESDIPVEEVREQAYIQQLHSEQARKKRASYKAQEEQKAIIDNYNRLLEQCEGEIPVTYDNLRTVMRYLATQNWGSWKLPKMSVSYAAHQYDCNGRTAVTIVLDEPSTDPEIANEKCFVYGNPHGHLMKYRKIK